ncbi:Mth938-like domain-containing protein [Leptospira interrogans]
MPDGSARYPYQAPIDAYGNGGFRFADMSHRGSILCLPSGIYAWDVTSADGLDLRSFDRMMADKDRILFLLLGTGRTQVFPSRALRNSFEMAGLGLEPMDTGAACRTYNVLLAERRPVAAALIAVD